MHVYLDAATAVKFARQDAPAVNYAFSIREPSSDSIERPDLFPAVIHLHAIGERRAKVWNKVRPVVGNPDGSINSAYGYEVFHRKSCKSEFAQHGPITPWTWACHSLKRNPITDEAVIRFSHPRHQWFGCKDQPELLHGVFRIEGDRLCFTVVARATDADALGWELPWHVHLMEKMRDDLARHCALKLGTYTHFTHRLYRRGNAA